MAGKQAFRDNLVERFPREEKAIDRYLHMLEDVGRAMPMVTMGRFLKPWQRTLVKPLLDRLAPGYLYRTTWEVLSELTQDRDLIAVRCGQRGDLGLPPRRSEFLVHAQIRKGSGEAFTRARVGRIVVENGITRGVQMEDGTRIDCNCVVSSAGVFNTFERLLEPAVVRRAGYDTLLEGGRPSISFPSARDPDYARRHPGTSTIEIVAPAPCEWFDRWKDQPWSKRGEDYDAFITKSPRRLRARTSVHGGAVSPTALTMTRNVSVRSGSRRAGKSPACGSPGRTSSAAASWAR
ncbi:MAG: hypothetical protein CALGDGBN_02509 [Pseudomonadales bacterium]|nr:hypothetical protein [Pseudomonadales bacterium]